MTHFQRLFVGQVLALAGDGLFKMCLPLLVLAMTGSATKMALTFALTFLPYLLFSLLGGVMADVCSRRWILVLGKCGVLCVFAVGGVFWGLSWLVVCVLCGGVCGSVGKSVGAP